MSDSDDPKQLSDPETRKAPVRRRRRRFITSNELIICLIVIAIVSLVLVVTINRRTTSHDIASARTVSNEVITDIAKRNGSAIRSLGSPAFKRSYSAAGLTQGFKYVEIATLKTPTLSSQTIVNTSDGPDISFIYTYTALKVPFYVLTTIEGRSGHWYLTAIDGNADETQLTQLINN